MKMTVEELISNVPADLYAKCMGINAEMTTKAAQGMVNLINSTGWLAIPAEDGVREFITACINFAAAN